MKITSEQEDLLQTDGSYYNLIKKNRDFRFLWFGQIISLLGDWFNLIAASTLVAELTGSGTAIGGLFVVRMLAPFIVSPLAGVVADRVNHKYILVTSDILRAVTVLGFLFIRDPGDVWLLYTLTFIQLGISGFFFPSRNAILPDIVTGRDLGAANALSAATWSVMLALGAALGGIASGTWGVYTAFIIDSATFVMSALLLAQISYKAVLTKESFARTLRNSVHQYIDGLNYLFKHTDIFFIALNKAAITLFSFGGFQVIQVRISEKIFVIGEGGSTSLGLMFAIAGVGTGLGPIIVRRYIGDRQEALRKAIIAGYILIIAGMLIITPLADFGSVLTGIMIRGIGGGIVWVFSTQLLLQLLPNNYRGRVFSTEFALFTLMSAFGAGAVGGVMDMVPDLSTLIFAMTMIGLVPTIFWTGWTFLNYRESRL